MKKKVLALLMAGLMGLTMAACSGSSGGNSGFEGKKAKDVEFADKVETKDFTVDPIKDWTVEKEEEQEGEKGSAVNISLVNDDVFISVDFLMSDEKITQEDMEKEVKDMMKEGDEEAKEVDPITIDGVKLKGFEMTGDPEVYAGMKSITYYGFAKEKPFVIIIVDGNDGKENSKIPEVWSMIDTIKFK